MVLNDIYFPVDKVKSSLIFQKEFERHIEYAIVRKDNKKVLHMCSRIYELITNEELFEAIRKELVRILPNHSVDQIPLKVRSDGDIKYFGDFFIPGIASLIEEGDIIQPVVEVGNAYNATTGCFVKLGFLRKKNSLILRGYSRDIFRYKKNLTGSFHNQLKMAMTRLGFLIKDFDNEVTNFKRLKGYKLEPHDIDAILLKIKTRTHYPKKLLEEVIKACDNNPGIDNKFELYCLLNRILFEANTKMHLDIRTDIDKGVGDVVERWEG